MDESSRGSTSLEFQLTSLSFTILVHNTEMATVSTSQDPGRGQITLSSVQYLEKSKARDLLLWLTDVTMLCVF